MQLNLTTRELLILRDYLNERKFSNNLNDNNEITIIPDRPLVMDNGRGWIMDIPCGYKG